MAAQNILILAVNNDVIELQARERLHWVTRKRYLELADISHMLEKVIAAGGDISTIRHIFDEPETMKGIRSRFARWESSKKSAEN